MSAVRTEFNVGDSGPMSRGRTHSPACGRIPNLCGAIIAGGGDEASIPAVNRGSDLPLVPQRRARWRPGGGVPDFGRAIAAGTEQMPSVRTEADRFHAQQM